MGWVPFPYYYELLIQHPVCFLGHGQEDDFVSRFEASTNGIVEASMELSGFAPFVFSAVLQGTLISVDVPSSDAKRAAEFLHGVVASLRKRVPPEALLLVKAEYHFIHREVLVKIVVEREKSFDAWNVGLITAVGTVCSLVGTNYEGSSCLLDFRFSPVQLELTE
ncbi:MAG: hypothetical protein HY420_04850 [Candidatus Kerfeldbacteria bacterium]|nr:hypothetical protein [Candidatus Kerfeldbacteria bacterium]